MTYGLLRAAMRRVTWKVLVVTLAVAGAVYAWMVTETELTVLFEPVPVSRYISRAVQVLLMALCAMMATLIADEAVDRGARRLPAYAWAIVLGTAVAALAQAPVHLWVQMDSDAHGRSMHLFWQPLGVFLEYLLWVTICVTVYVNRRTALRAVQRMNAAQLARARAQRQTFESRLQALQARIEPQFLSTTLSQVRKLHDSDPARGMRLLDDLIVYLRATLPRLREPSSTLAQELQLASAYLNIRQPDAKHEPARVGTGALGARMPPMLLLPLIDRLLASRPQARRETDAIGIAVTRHGRLLRVEVNGPNTPALAQHSMLDDVRERLRMLYGDDSRLSVDDARGRTRISLEIPHDSAHGAHR